MLTGIWWRPGIECCHGLSVSFLHFAANSVGRLNFLWKLALLRTQTQVDHWNGPHQVAN
jgi:hypothetical protein